MNMLEGWRFIKDKRVMLEIVQVAGSFESRNKHPGEREGEKNRQHAENTPAHCLRAQNFCSLFHPFRLPRFGGQCVENRTRRPAAMERETERWQRPPPSRRPRSRYRMPGWQAPEWCQTARPA